MISELRDFLIRERASFEVIRRRDAGSLSTPPTPDAADGGRLAKVVPLRDGDRYALAVLPETAAFDLAGFRRRAGQYALTLAKEDEVRSQFPELARGSLPPFGRMLGIPVYLDRGLAEETAMMFESGADREMVSMPMREYVRAERPAITPLARALRAA